MRTKIERWTWKHFLVGFLCGGGWLSLTFAGAETVEKAFSLVAMGIVIGCISGLYSAVSKSALRALGTGFTLFFAQMIVNIGALAVGLSEFRYGM
jgi:glucose uptake protein GlcU